MIWFILYVLIAAAVVFGLMFGCIKLNIRNSLGDPVVVVPIICGIFWPMCAPVYAAYLAAVWYATEK